MVVDGTVSEYEERGFWTVCYGSLEKKERFLHGYNDSDERMA